MLRIRGVVLPEREERTFWIDGEVLRAQLREHRDAGVLAVRTPGTAARMPAWVDEPPVPLALLTAVVTAVHAAGGRVAVHCQTAEGSRNAVLAGADSLEHGMSLDPALLDRMAAQGTAFVPTPAVFGAGADAMRAREPSARRDLWLAGWDAMFGTVRAAHEAGVTVLAGTDSFPCGTVAGEASWLARAGLPADAALGAASWTARAWLGLPGLVDGAPADLVAYGSDPVADPAVLEHPDRIVLRGRVVR
ncbi:MULTISPECIES: amidohydrolase family protein [unclassified Streptomyces]|uniref:amidohydrolase family protein n=1 Tax=unclassified Streptomyces TaxID=2593676 RepID=UPI001F543F28|nr:MULTISPECIES: amidohydrolase family protein [unclassified Streptomyces]